jgi:hypothetical protein
VGMGALGVLVAIPCHDRHRGGSPRKHGGVVAFKATGMGADASDPAVAHVKMTA